MRREDDFTQKLYKRDEDAYHEVIRQYSRLLWLVASEILSPCEQDIEDCISDVFIDLWKRPKKFDPARGTLKTYLVICTRSRALNMRKKNSRAVVVSLDDYCGLTDDSFDETLDKICRKDGYQRLYQAIGQLTPPADEIIVRRYFFNQKPAMIAERLKCTVKEVENKLYRGKQKLADILAEYKEEFFDE